MNLNVLGLTLAGVSTVTALTLTHERTNEKTKTLCPMQSRHNKTQEENDNLHFCAADRKLQQGHLVPKCRPGARIRLLKIEEHAKIRSLYRTDTIMSAKIA